ncbi:hypothetical protein FRC19_004109 [Serendipita sp. 401]|nr:hypothetical protein FRC19_004109 [Serendipita sp. 401]
MSNLCDDAWTGNLTNISLQNYLKGGARIDEPGGQKNMTPLAAAALAGRQDTVQLLLDAGADPNALSPRGRTALFHATTRPNRIIIVRMLLAAGAQVNRADDNQTVPLMNAVAQTKDKDVIHELMDHGADATIKNKQNKSPADIAKAVGLDEDVKPRPEREAYKGKIVDLIVSLVLLIIAWVNSGILKDAVKGIAKKLYGISGERNDALEQEIPEPGSAKALANNVDNYVNKTGLNKFFPPGDPFLRNLAEKAAALRDDPTTSLGQPGNIERLTFLSMYQPVIYCDDSGSMSTDDRYIYQRELVKRITRIATRIVPDNYGVELRFINSDSTSGKTMADIETAVGAVSPSGWTAIGTNLQDKILKPLVYDVINSGNKLDRPFLICTITDGDPTKEPEDKFKSAIVECKRFLVGHGYQPQAVMFCISQIGNDPSAKVFLDGLRQDKEIEDVIYVTTDQLDAEFKKQQEESQLELWLLELLTKPLMERYSD